MKKSVFLWVLLAMSFLSYGQISFNNYLTTNTGSNGLLDNMVNDICKDHEGRYWFGTVEGISIFDGTNWETLYEVDGVELSTSCIFRDSQNNIWIAAGRNYLLKYRDNNWTKFKADSSFTNYWINSIIEDKDHNIWTGSHFGISKFDGTNWTNYSNGGYITCMACDSSGNLWAGSTSGVYQFDGTQWNHILDHGLNHIIYDIHVDRNHNLWFGTYGNGAIVFDGANWSHFTEIANITGIEEDENGTMYFTSEYTNHGLYVKTNNTLTSFNKSNSNIIGNDIDKMVNADGEIWLIKWGAGACSFVNGEFNTMNCDGLIDNHVFSIFQDNDGRYWFGTQVNACSFKDGKWDSYLNPWEGGVNTNSIKGNSVSSITQGISNALYFGTDHYVSVLKNNNWTQVKSFPHSQILTNFKDSQGNLWFSTSEGITKYDYSAYSDYIFPDSLVLIQNPPYPPTYYAVPHLVYSMDQDQQGKIYAGDFEYGLRVYDGSEWTLTDSLKGINSVFCDLDDNIWLGTIDGLKKISNATLTTITKQDGLLSDTITSILVDYDQRLWVGTRLGLSMLDSTGVWRHFDVSNGLCHNNIICMYEDHAKTLWFGTSRGVSKLEHEDDGMTENDPFSISFFPNPCKDRLYYESNVSDFSVEVYNSLGKKVFTTVCDKSQGEINLQQVPEGYVLLRLRKDNYSTSKRIIKIK